MNECDNCGESDYSERLIWITAEDFEPDEWEYVPDWAYKKFDALCDMCYKQLVNGKLEEEDIE